MARQTTTITTVTCDGCKAVIPATDKCGHVLDMDFCLPCLVKLFHETEREYRRLVHGEVKGRRGWRVLGEIDS